MVTVSYSYTLIFPFYVGFKLFHLLVFRYHNGLRCIAINPPSLYAKPLQNELTWNLMFSFFFIFIILLYYVLCIYIVLCFHISFLFFHLIRHLRLQWWKMNHKQNFVFDYKNSSMIPQAVFSTFGNELFS